MHGGIYSIGEHESLIKYEEDVVFLHTAGVSDSDFWHSDQSVDSQKRKKPDDQTQI